MTRSDIYQWIVANKDCERCKILAKDQNICQQSEQQSFVFPNSDHASRVHASVCLYCSPLSNIGVSGVFGVVCMCVCLHHVFSNLSACPRIHVCLFSPPAHTGFPDLCVCLAAAGQLINQIFKQCSSAQWVVPDYPWMLAVHGPATLHASSWTGIAT